MTLNQKDSDQLRRFFRKIMVAFAFLGFTVAGTVYYTWTVSQNNKDALCAYKNDLNRRITEGEAFLKNNPNGIPGIPAKTLQNSIDNQKQAAKSFSIVNC